MSTSAPFQVKFGIESIHPLEPAQNYFQILGWAHFPGGKNRVLTRVRIGNRFFPADEVITRADIAAAFPGDRYASEAGFKILGYLPFGFYEGTLEASPDEGRSWITLKALAIPVGAHPLRGDIPPPNGGTSITQTQRIEGWCFHPEFVIREVVLQFGNVEISCEYGLARPDVGERFWDTPRAATCGFISTENLPQGSGNLKLRAVTECGRTYFLSSSLTVDIRTGWHAKPPPPSPVQDLSTVQWQAPQSHSNPISTDSGHQPTGERNILFVLYGDFSSNSALHVAALANALIAEGYDCVVAVPRQKETVGALPRSHFMAVEFSELPNLSAYFKNGLGPRVVHAWTPREIVRTFCEALAKRYASRFVVHLEDNEQEILSQALGVSVEDLLQLSEAELDHRVSPQLTHPIRAATLLQAAAGVTVIVERLKDHAPAATPSHVIWPAADPDIFIAQPRNDTLRASLQIAPDDIVLFYHGNVHAANSTEVGSLYEAVALLNQRGCSTYLIRTGRDFERFDSDHALGLREHVIHLGHVEKARHLPPLMAMADYFVQPGLPGAFNDYRFPSKLPEFFAIGRPVILPASNLAHSLRHGEEAWVLPQADTESIADAIQSIHAQPELRQSLSDGALAVSARRFSWNKSARALADFYQSLAPRCAGMSE